MRGYALSRLISAAVELLTVTNNLNAIPRIALQTSRDKRIPQAQCCEKSPQRRMAALVRMGNDVSRKFAAPFSAMKASSAGMEDRIPYKGWHVLLSRRGDRWVADIVPKGASATSFIIHAGSIAAVVNAAFAAIDAEEGGLGERPRV
jgi:hypothetical protein